MALSVTNRVETVMGDRRVITCDVAFDSSYPTGGEALAPSTLGLTTVDFCVAEPKGGRAFVYDRTNSKLLVYGVPALDGNAASAQALAQVANTTDLSSVTGVRIFAFGK